MRVTRWLVGVLSLVLVAVLATAGRQVKIDTWHDPRLIIVHDVEMPIPLYYIEPVVADIEDAYLQLASSERRSFNLHTDFNWEKSLPNLNPRRSEIAVDWSLRVLVEGLLARVLTLEGGSWIWRVDENDVETLGQNLSAALYRICEIHRSEDLQKDLNRQISAALEALGPDAEQERRQSLISQLETLLNQMNRREMRGSMSREDVLDRPILRAFLAELHKGLGAVGATGGLYDGIDVS